VNDEENPYRSPQLDAPPRAAWWPRLLYRVITGGIGGAMASGLSHVVLAWCEGQVKVTAAIWCSFSITLVAVLLLTLVLPDPP